ncbi:hypothetical protein MBLNU230_g3275t1 [Neophaeotheca triangularis]
MHQNLITLALALALTASALPTGTHTSLVPNLSNPTDLDPELAADMAFAQNEDEADAAPEFEFDAYDDDVAEFLEPEGHDVVDEDLKLFERELEAQVARMEAEMGEVEVDYSGEGYGDLEELEEEDE